MQFKIKNTEVKISFSFFAVFLFFIINGNIKIYVYSLLSSLIHEFVHIFFIKVFDGNIAEFSLSLFGGNIKRGSHFIVDNFKEAIINISAPTINIIFGVIFTIIFGEKNLFGIINLVIGFFNILPFYTFDGGRGLYFILTMHLEEKTVDVIIIILSLIVTTIFSFISVFVFFNYYENYFLLIMCIYMIVSVIINIKSTSVC